MFIKSTGSKDKPFQIYACDESQGIIGQTGLTFQLLSANVQQTPLTWSIESFSGDILNVAVDSLTGVVTYDAVTELTNNGKAVVVYCAEDNKGVKVCNQICIELKDPTSITTLACNNDMIESFPDTANKYTLFGKVSETSVFQDVAKTTPALDGDEVLALEDGNGNGDLTVRTGNNGPTYRKGTGPNNTDFLQFDANQNDSLQYDVSGAPAPGTPFSFFALFSFDLASVSGNGTLIASELQSNNNSTATGTWQLSHSGGDGDFVFRLDGGTWTNFVVGNVNGNQAQDADISLLTEVADSQPHLIFVDYDGTTVQVYLDGVLRLQADPGQALRGEHFKFFENRAGTDFVSGNLYEAVYGDSTLSAEEKTITQAYFLCKFGLDAALIADPGPFKVDQTKFYRQISQFELHALANGTQTVYDTLNNTYYDPCDVPTPGLGLFLDPQTEASVFKSVVTDSNPGGNTIATHNDGNGSIVNINETVTGLSLATNTLTYTKEDGTQDIIDLSLYFDDTNLARLVSGTVNPAGIATFTRDDTSTFTIDFSQFFDDTNTTSVVAPLVTGNTIATHNDGDGNIVNIEETVTGFSVSANTITYTKEDGTNDTAQLQFTTLPLYEYKEIWAEESGNISSNNSQWSFGNGAVGTIGIPIDNDWEIIGTYLQADSGGSAGESLTVGVMDFQNNTNTTIVNIPITAAGDGQNDNAFIYNDLTGAPVAAPNGAVIGFRTATEVGAWADVRAGVRLRRKVGDYVNGVTLI